MKMSVAGSHLCPLSASPSQTATATEQKPAASLRGTYQGTCMFDPFYYKWYTLYLSLFFFFNFEGR